MEQHLKFCSQNNQSANSSTISIKTIYLLGVLLPELVGISNQQFKYGNNITPYILN